MGGTKEPSSQMTENSGANKGLPEMDPVKTPNKMAFQTGPTPGPATTPVVPINTAFAKQPAPATQTLPAILPDISSAIGGTPTKSDSGVFRLFRNLQTLGERTTTVNTNTLIGTSAVKPNLPKPGFSTAPLGARTIPEPSETTTTIPSSLPPTNANPQAPKLDSKGENATPVVPADDSMIGGSGDDSLGADADQNAPKGSAAVEPLEADTLAEGSEAIARGDDDTSPKPGTAEISGVKEIMDRSASSSVINIPKKGEPQAAPRDEPYSFVGQRSGGNPVTVPSPDIIEKSAHFLHRSLENLIGQSPANLKGFAEKKNRMDALWDLDTDTVKSLVDKTLDLDFRAPLGKRDPQEIMLPPSQKEKSDFSLIPADPNGRLEWAEQRADEFRHHRLYDTPVKNEQYYQDRIKWNQIMAELYETDKVAYKHFADTLFDAKRHSSQQIAKDVEQMFKNIPGERTMAEGKRRMVDRAIDLAYPGKENSEKRQALHHIAGEIQRAKLTPDSVGRAPIKTIEKMAKRLRRTRNSLAIYGVGTAIATGIAPPIGLGLTFVATGLGAKVHVDADLLKTELNKRMELARRGGDGDTEDQLQNIFNILHPPQPEGKWDGRSQA